MARFCTKCGNQLNDDDFFCAKCGSKVEASTQPANDEIIYNDINISHKRGKLGLIITVAIVLIAIIIAIVFSLGNKSENISNEDNSKVAVDVADEKENTIKRNGLSEDSNIATTYIGFLRNGGFGDYSSYYLYDMDADGCEELLVISATCEADAMLYVYKYDNGEVSQIGSTAGGHCSICGNSKEKGITIHYGHQGVEWMDTAVIKNNTLVVEELVTMREVQNYTEFDYCIPLEYNSIDDMSILTNYGGVDDYVSSNAININLGTINTSVSAFLEDYSYRGGHYLSNWENSMFTTEDSTIYNLEMTGTETNYYLHDQYMTITARGDTIVGVSQAGFQVSDIDNTYQLLKWLGGNAAELLNYEPEIIYKDQYTAYLKWEVNNGYMVVYTTWYQGLTDWKKSLAWNFCIFTK